MDDIAGQWSFARSEIDTENGDRCLSTTCRARTYFTDAFKPIADQRPVKVTAIKKIGIRTAARVREQGGLKADSCYEYTQFGTRRPPCVLRHACSLCLAASHPAYICPQFRQANILRLVDLMENNGYPRQLPPRSPSPVYSRRFPPKSPSPMNQRSAGASPVRSRGIFPTEDREVGTKMEPLPLARPVG